MNSAAITLRPMTMDDAAAIARLQLETLPDSVFAPLGVSFLQSVHVAALAHPSTRALVALDASGEVAAFALATVDSPRLNAHLRRRLLAPMAAAILARRQFGLALRLLRSTASAAPEPRIELMLLSVRADMRRRGIARQLLERLESMLRADGIRQYHVAVRTYSGDRRAVYDALGFTYEQTAALFGAPMTFLSRRLP